MHVWPTKMSLNYGQTTRYNPYVSSWQHKEIPSCIIILPVGAVGRTHSSVLITLSNPVCFSRRSNTALLISPPKALAKLARFPVEKTKTPDHFKFERHAILLYSEHLYHVY